MWLGGWKSRVAMRRAKGRVSRSFKKGVSSRAPGTARGPFWVREMLVNGSGGGGGGGLGGE